MTDTTTYPTNDRVEAFMARKRQEPGFGKRRYTVRASVGKATITLHKAALRRAA